MTTPPRLLLGTAQLTTDYGVTNARPGGPARAESIEMVSAAVAAGITGVDTAPVYGDAEEVLGESTEPFTVHTKVRPGTRPSTSLRESRARLGHHRVEVLYLHDPDEILHRDGPSLVDARLCTADGTTALGASIYELAQFDAALDDPTVAYVQVPANLLDRRFTADALERAVACGTRVVIRSALLQGVLATPADQLPASVAHLRPHVGLIGAIARESGLSPIQLALAWVLGLPHVDALVIGASTVAELEQLVCASRARPDAEVMAALDAIALPDPASCDPRRWAPR